MPYEGAPKLSASIVISLKSLSCVTEAEPDLTSSRIARKWTMESWRLAPRVSSLQRALSAVHTEREGSVREQLSKRSVFGMWRLLLLELGSDIQLERLPAAEPGATPKQP